MRITHTNSALLAAVVAIALAGCQDTGDPTGQDTPARELPVGMNNTHDHHAHASEGPHHGELVELANGEFHAEIVHDHEARTLEIYLLDKTAAQQVAIESPDITINVTHDGKPEQFTLTAKPDDGDEAGKSSKFVSADKALMSHLGTAGKHPRLVVQINRKTYRGEIRHNDGRQGLDQHHGHDHRHDTAK